MKPRKLVVIALMFIVATATPVLLTGCEGSNIGSGGVITASSCKYDDNLSETAQSFIGRCRKGGINREFPGEYEQVSLREIKRDKSDRGKTAYKLLNDRRFRK